MAYLPCDTLRTMLGRGGAKSTAPPTPHAPWLAGLAEVLGAERVSHDVTHVGDDSRVGLVCVPARTTDRIQPWQPPHCNVRSAC